MVADIFQFIEGVEKKADFFLYSDNVKEVKGEITGDSDLFLREMLQEDFEEKYNVEIEAGSLEFNKVSGLEMNWELTLENMYIYGGMKINGLIDALIMPPDSYYEFNACEHDFLMPDDEVFLKEETNWFSKSGHGSGDGTYGIFYRKENTPLFEIKFLDEGRLFNTDFTLETYYQSMMDSMAICGWQYFYLNFDEIKNVCGDFRISSGGWLTLYPYSNNMSESPLGRDITEETLRIDAVLHHMKKCVYVLPKIFPEKDFSYHKERYNNFKAFLGRN